MTEAITKTQTESIHTSNLTANTKEQITKKLLHTSVSPLFKHYQQNLILFAYDRQQDQDCPAQILIMQQSKKKHKTLSQEDQMYKMLSHCNLDGKKQQLFLSKIDMTGSSEIAEEIKDLLNIADTHSRRDRAQRRKKIFEESRINKINSNMASEEVLARRNIRVVKMDSLLAGGAVRGVVNLGGKEFQYQDLGFGNKKIQYYALHRKMVSPHEIFPQVSIEENLLNEIDFEVETKSEKDENDDDFDSNNSDNSAFDYPDQQSNSRSSQEIIRDYDEDDIYHDHSEQQDEQEVYHRYLRRQRRKDREMDDENEYKYEEYD